MYLSTIPSLTILKLSGLLKNSFLYLSIRFLPPVVLRPPLFIVGTGILALYSRSALVYKESADFTPIRCAANICIAWCCGINLVVVVGS